ncbi:hypothetical protein [Flavobacterium xanthum]|uniref:Outer membrane protein beta-barrel domain-containing protein n=1 Tax=Flavobacterium xanthum TaxID=69322 RepID=A0A1M7EAX1_9FLAO|nr:hypothetical protein [Flavobacterium xanthum]SHL88894.1 hypothetical protein SAMN05443669_101661 [Flavobacterium xanthum]
MNDKKNIDRFFQEQFKDFESHPNEQVWNNIQTALNEKKNRKVLPAWIKFSGTAAAFLVGIFALHTVINDKVKTNNPVVIESKVPKTNVNEKESIPNESIKERPSLEIKTGPQVVENSGKTKQSEQKESINSTGFKINSNKEKNQKEAVVYLQTNNLSLKHPATALENKKATAVTEAKTDDLFEKIQQLPLEKTSINPLENTRIALQDTKKEPSTASAIPNELDEILKKKTDQKKEVVKIHQQDKWQITPNIAAVYLNSNSGGSAIDAQFSENQKTAENSLSFGVGIHYAVSKKIALRSGINKLSLGYNTNNVIYSTGLANNNLANIAYTSTALIEINNEATLSMLSAFEKDIQKTNTGALNQKMGYYEVPLELSYSVLDKKFGITIIGGVSTLFLNQNKISLVSEETNLKLGEATNLNQIHFSTNVGLGFKYKIIKSFQINFEPMLKYQVNTFSNDSGNFKPLFIGLYSGISYSF